jgi:hypothetical protein
MSAERGVFTSSEVCQLAGISPRGLQRLLEAGAIEPAIKGGRGRYAPRWFSITQAAGIAYAQAFQNAGCHISWAYEACAWVAAQQPDDLLKEFARGNTLLCLAPITEQTRLVPLNKPDATRELRIRLAQLNLEIVYRRVVRRAAELEAAGPSARAAGSPPGATVAAPEAPKNTPPTPPDNHPVGKPVNKLPRRSVKVIKRTGQK